MKIQISESESFILIVDCHDPRVLELVVDQPPFVLSKATGNSPSPNSTSQSSCFIGFLKDEIKMTVKLFKPQSLKAAIEKARMQEESLQVGEKKKRSNVKVVQASGVRQWLTYNLAMSTVKSNTIKPLPIELVGRFMTTGGPTACNRC
ncbi:hypothetical protein HAX54_034160 [Datura stramonium]|uniref:Uncharacterized protein n=1 Tax=Datura stramonium TaxID=4076 RepID=A0ABS8VGB0_DATST|nr:hypothetical protein [Datura stramonium]